MSLEYIKNHEQERVKISFRNTIYQRIQRRWSWTCCCRCEVRAAKTRFLQFNSLRQFVDYVLNLINIRIEEEIALRPIIEFSSQ